MTEQGFGILAHPGSTNRGDDIQTLAAADFLPRVDAMVARERLDAAPPRPLRTILNGWFLDDARRWPPHPLLQPLLISFHLTETKPSRLRRWRPTVQAALLARRGRAYFDAHGPVGARDLRTLELLRSSGVEAYHSGCLTLTLRRNGAPRGDEVIACDLPPPLVTEIGRRIGRAPAEVTHSMTPGGPLSERFSAADALLRRYAAARAVITTRLHAALPCLAFGTPVLFIDAGSDPSRIAPALELAHHATPAEFLAGIDGFDPLRPPPNPDRHRPLAEALARRCAAFVPAEAVPA